MWATTGPHLCHAHITNDISQNLKLSGIHHHTNRWDHQPNLLALTGRALGPSSLALGMRRIMSSSCAVASRLADAQLDLEGVKDPPELAHPCCSNYLGVCSTMHDCSAQGLQTHTR